MNDTYLVGHQNKRLSVSHIMSRCHSCAAQKWHTESSCRYWNETLTLWTWPHGAAMTIASHRRPTTSGMTQSYIVISSCLRKFFKCDQNGNSRWIYMHFNHNFLYLYRVLTLIRPQQQDTNQYQLFIEICRWQMCTREEYREECHAWEWQA